ncbi:hypothetical protein Pcar_3489 [Syntrophotalea carbinolica DSM 2380]|uniref:Uncharacterized protein n=1 Tax=Syntrophotalea carbinolica (strain DSM 2380 / NBRC 103641 / GraBd1) TaxID=338963 RepID=J9TJS6_SYNC1|nr:hypothetical protein Pcar_3489 [Syntrophotalea carbinolica DSM 2380]
MAEGISGTVPFQVINCWQPVKSANDRPGTCLRERGFSLAQNS